METKDTSTSNQDQILKAFQQLLSEQKHVASKIATKQEDAEREEDKKVVERASTYTVESIVKGLADLQLNFGGEVDSLVENLAVEAPKLEELRRAMRVETEHLEELRHIRIAADALDILIQEHQAKTKAFEEKSQQERQALDREIAETKQAWQKGQTEFDAALKARQESVKKERAQHEADYRYELERKRKIEADEYTDHKVALERKIAEEEAKKVADWAEREQILAEVQELLKKYRVMGESFPQELEEAVSKARAEAIREINEEANVQAELSEKEMETDKEVYELKIASLQATIEQQARQIEHLTAQLQAALKQVQELAVKALESSRKSGQVNIPETA